MIEILKGRFWTLLCIIQFETLQSARWCGIREAAFSKFLWHNTYLNGLKQSTANMNIHIAYIVTLEQKTFRFYHISSTFYLLRPMQSVCSTVYSLVVIQRLAYQHELNKKGKDGHPTLFLGVPKVCSWLPKFFSTVEKRRNRKISATIPFRERMARFLKTVSKQGFNVEVLAY